MAKTRRWLPVACGLLLGVSTAQAQVWSGKTDPDGYTFESLKATLPEYFMRTGGRSGGSPEALPDVFGTGAVLNVGNIHMKVTNFGHLGNFFTNLSGDPAGQWPGASGIEYVSTIRLAVGAVNTVTQDPAGKRRVSYLFEWRPETLDPVDRIYKGFDGVVGGVRLANDDGDTRNDQGSGSPVEKMDEDFQDGHDNDRDGRIDEDFAALGQQMFSCVQWDNTIQAVNTTFNEKHIPIGLEVRQKSWAYSIRGLQDFNVSEYEVFNRSGGDLDSVTVGFLVDMDAGVAALSNFFQDDFDLPHFPSGEFVLPVGETPPLGLPDDKDHLKQVDRDPTIPDRPGGQPLCPMFPLRINGFSIADDDGDLDRTTGIPSFLLIDNSIDPLGRNGPRRVGFRSFRSFTAGTPFTGGGNPTIDQQRFEFMTGTDNLDRETGFISRSMPAGDTKGDYVEWVSIGSPLDAGGPGQSNGMWKLGNGQSFKVTIAFAVQTGRYEDLTGYNSDYERYQLGTLRLADLFARYPALTNAVTAQITFEGVHTTPSPLGLFVDAPGSIEVFPPSSASGNSPPFHGRETAVRQPTGSGDTLYFEDCPDRDPRQVFVNSREWSWFDFDCNYCTGPWSYIDGRGTPMNGILYKKTWNAEAPPPNPALNVSSNYNFTDNPGRRYSPGGDRQITLAWDNLSETTADPKSGCFDFRGYRIWKVSDWTRPVGSAGPAEGDWKLIGEYRYFDYDVRGNTVTRNYTVDTAGDTICPLIYVPNYQYSDSITGEPRVGKEIPICLDRGDLWNPQTGHVIKPDTLDCIRAPGRPDSCVQYGGGIVHRDGQTQEPCKEPQNQEKRIAYPIGRYRYVDREVKNGFVYFYSVTALDSTSKLDPTTGRVTATEQEGRRSAVEADAVSPQIAAVPGRGVWVVPNPYRGYTQIQERPSTWDLTPNASDPTGTHIDFFGLPPGQWTIKIFTVSGDLVETMRSTDPVNESVRAPQTLGSGAQVPGYNRQQDYEGDGQARWNLISRNGQDVVSGVYIFTVESGQGTQRGRFVIIR